MEFGLIFIIIVIIGLVSAASKGKKQQQDNKGQQPARPTMSDIQRAFMMMTGADDDEEQTPPQNQAYSRPYTPAPPAPSAAPAREEGMSDYGTMRSGSMSAASVEGRAYMPSAPMISRLEDAYEPEETEPIEMEGSVYGEDLSLIDSLEQTHTKSALKLFESQSDYAKAVIYSEILSRRQRGRRS